jgi:hypothetical protein
MSLRNTIKKILKEDVTSLPSMKYKEPGAEAGLARAEMLGSEIEKNLASLGVYDIQDFMENKGIFSVERIRDVKEFPMSFTIKGGETLKGLAKYDFKSSKKFSTIVLDFDTGDEVLKIIFEKNSIKRPFMSQSNWYGKYKGDKSALVGIQEGGVFVVKILGYKPPIVGPTEIKINKIGIKKGGKSGKVGSLQPGKFYKAKAEIDFTTGSDEGPFTTAVKREIVNRASNGDYFISPSESNREMLIFSTKPSKVPGKGGEYFTVTKRGITDPKNPMSWFGEVEMGDKPHGRMVGPGVKANISQIILE